ncbi:MAG: dihydropteroate synthase [Bacteroidales bacterium]|nr:dihydropteroate synthase [Bacteroidales bacterium]
MEERILRIGTRKRPYSIGLPAVMGILNVTPDSFYDGGRYADRDSWLRQTERMVNEGASVIDIGVMSTRPGSEAVNPDEEMDRLLPVVETVMDRFPEIPVSVDTYRATVAEEACRKGAAMINDISGGKMDKDMPGILARYGISYVMMHIQGTPCDMQQNPVYTDVVEDIIGFFRDQTHDFIENKGVKGQIILDPGFGFGKTLEHNYRILSSIGRFRELGFPLMAGLSRKSMICKALGITPGEALNGTTVLNTIALLRGVDVLRVHDVREAVEVITLVNKIMEL